MAESVELKDWVLVPREPTDAMLDAFHDALHSCQDDRFSECVIAGYRAMISASPAPEGGEEGEGLGSASASGDDGAVSFAAANHEAAPSAAEAVSPGDAKETDRRLNAEADYFYFADDWETTHNDLNGVAEQTELHWNCKGEVAQVGRLKQLPYAYAVNLPVSWHEGEADDWEVFLFPTRAEAEAAFRAAMKAAPTTQEAGHE